MTVATPAAKPAARPAAARRRRRIWLVAGLAVAVVGGAAEVAVWAHQRAADRRQAADDARLAAVLADTARTKDYKGAGRRIAAGGFGLDRIKRAVADEFHRQANLRVDGYFNQKTAADRTAYLDKVIDEVILYRKVVGGSGSAAQKSRSANKAAMIQWTIQQPPVARARLSEFGAAFNARLAQRGQPPFDGPMQ